MGLSAARKLRPLEAPNGGWQSGYHAETSGRGQEGGDHAQASNVGEKHCTSSQHPVRHPHDLLRGWRRGFGMASQGVWVS